MPWIRESVLCSEWSTSTPSLFSSHLTRSVPCALRICLWRFSISTSSVDCSCLKICLSPQITPTSKFQKLIFGNSSSNGKIEDSRMKRVCHLMSLLPNIFQSIYWCSIRSVLYQDAETKRKYTPCQSTSWWLVNDYAQKQAMPFERMNTRLPRCRQVKLGWLIIDIWTSLEWSVLFLFSPIVHSFGFQTSVHKVKKILIKLLIRDKQEILLWIHIRHACSKLQLPVFCHPFHKQLMKILVVQDAISKFSNFGCHWPDLRNNT